MMYDLRVTYRHFAALCGLAALAVLVGGAASKPDPREQWGQWRGPLGNGVAPRATPPLTWSEEKNVRWKRELPGKADRSGLMCGPIPLGGSVQDLGNEPLGLIEPLEADAASDQRHADQQGRVHERLDQLRRHRALHEPWERSRFQASAPCRRASHWGQDRIVSPSMPWNPWRSSVTSSRRRAIAVAAISKPCAPRGRPALRASARSLACTCAVSRS